MRQFSQLIYLFNPVNYIEQTDISTVFPVTNSISVIGRWLYELRGQRTIGSLAGVEYSDCCWRVQVVARSFLEDEDDQLSKLDHGVFFRFELRGLSGFGGEESALAEEIRNYRERQDYRNERYQW